MRLTETLLRQHIGRAIRRHWIAQGKRTVHPDHTEKFLVSRGVRVEDAVDYSKEKLPRPRFDIVGPLEPDAAMDATHPDWKTTPCHVLKDTRVLVEGLTQAQLITKTVHVAEAMPEIVETLARGSTISNEIHEQVQRVIRSSCVFDATQEKLPIVKDPKRPAVKLPRSYGVHDIRKNYLLATKLLDIIEKNSDASKDRLAMHSANTVVSFTKDSDLIQIQSPSNILIATQTPLDPITDDIDSTIGIELPDMYPMKHTVTLVKENFYEMASSYPLCNMVKAYHPHTSFLNYNRTQVINLHGTIVTDDQLKGRCLMHCFTVAASYAYSIYGENVDVLPTPITVQCIQNDEGNFYFGILQLNTLNLNGRDGIKNMWYSLPKMSLYETCQYESAIPTLRGYNPEVYKYLNAFYNNK